MKKYINIIKMLSISTMFLPILNATNNKNIDSKIEAYNILLKKMNDNRHNTLPISKKYKYDFINKKNHIKKYNKLQNIDLFRIFDLYDKNEFKAASFLVNNMIVPINEKYIKLFNLLININIKINKNISIDNELKSLIYFGDYDYFFIKKIVEVLKYNNKNKDAILLLKSIKNVKNNFVKKIDLSYCKNKNEIKYIKDIINNKFYKQDIGNDLAYFYNENGELLEAYETYIKNNFNKNNNNKISNLRSQIKFRIKKFNSSSYSNKIKKNNQIIFKTEPFIVFKISTK